MTEFMRTAHQLALICLYYNNWNVICIRIAENTYLHIECAAKDTVNIKLLAIKPTISHYVKVIPMCT